MIRHLGFRRILPIAQLALFLLLVFLGAVSYKHAHDQHARLRPIAFQAHGQPFTPVANSEPVEWRFATLFNLPAIACGALLATAVAGPTSEFNVMLFAIPFVPITWLLLGRSLDYQLRYLPRPPRAITRVIFSSLGIATAILLLLMLVVSLPKSSGTEGQSWGALYLVTWAAILLTTSITSVVRRVP
jgi:hypothetical protein